MTTPTSAAAKTVFVVGAGASKEANLPIGAELKAFITNALDIRFEHGLTKVSGDDVILNAFRLAAQGEDPPSKDINPYLRAGWRIRDALPQALSIDQFLDSHYGDKRLELCGKLAIVRTILEAEKRSLLQVDRAQGHPTLDLGRLGQTWFTRFMHLVTDKCRRTDLESRFSSIAFVVFNYDRCIEQYLYYALQNFYGMKGPEALAVLQHLEIYHPYGTVGWLPWLNRGSTIEFGVDPHHTQLGPLAAEIKTFTEGTDPSSSEIVTIRERIRDCDRLVFLGFAFHPTNLDLLLPIGTAGVRPNKRVFATVKGISVSDVSVIGSDLQSRFATMPGYVGMGNLTCFELFHEYWRSLSLA